MRYGDRPDGRHVLVHAPGGSRLQLTNEQRLHSNMFQATVISSATCTMLPLHPGLAAHEVQSEIRNQYTVGSLITFCRGGPTRASSVHSATVKWPLSPLHRPRPTNSIMTRNKKFATRTVKNVHMFDTAMDTGSIDRCENHEGWQSFCQSLRWCLLLTVMSLSFLIRGGPCLGSSH